MNNNDDGFFWVLLIVSFMTCGGGAFMVDKDYVRGCEKQCHPLQAESMTANDGCVCAEPGNE